MVNIGPTGGGGSSDSGSSGSSDPAGDDDPTRTERVAREARRSEPEPAPPPDPEPEPRPDTGRTTPRDVEPAPAPQPEPAPSPTPDPEPQPGSGGRPDAGRTTPRDGQPVADPDPMPVDDPTRVSRGARDAISREPEPRPGLRDEVQQDVAGQLPGIGSEDIRSVEFADAEGRPDAGATRPAGGDRADLELTREAREDIVREQFVEQRQEAERTAAMTRLDREDVVPLSPFGLDEIRAEATGEGVSIGPTDEAAEEFVREEAREQAAAQAPLRDPEDFIVDDGQVRPRADPFFDEQRDALGVDLLPGAADDALTTDRGESRIRLGLREAAEAWNRGVTSDRFGDPVASQTEIANEEFGVDLQDQSRLFTGDFDERYAQALNPASAVLDTVGIAEQGANILQAEAETRAEMFDEAGTLDTEDVGDLTADVGPFGTDLQGEPEFGLPEDGPFVEDAGEPVNPFGLSVPEGSAAAEERAETTAAVERGVEAGAEQAQENPVGFLGTLAGGATFGVATGLGAGRIARSATGRVRTFGGTRIDAGDVMGEDVRRFYDDGAAGQRFPPFRDPEFARSDPAAAVSRQADDFTPGEIDAAIPGQDPVLFKALDTEPEGPARGRAAQGFRTQEGDYESIGASAGPELSPNFLRLQNRDFSVRPGLPDTGGRPTAVAVRTDVENPDADTLSGFNDEMLNRAGETTARPKPPDEVDVGEAEAVIPPEAEFADVGGGPFRNTLRRFGIGSDYFTEIGGQRVPIRTVAPADEVGGDGLFGRFLGDERGQVGAGDGLDAPATSGTLDYYGRAPEAPTDRPAPLAPGGSGLPGTEFVDSPTFGAESTAFYDADGFGTASPTADVDGGSRSPRDRDRDAPPSSGSGLPGTSSSGGLFGGSSSGLPGSSAGGPPSSGSAPPSDGSPGAPPSSPGSPPGSPAGPPSSPFGVPGSPGSPFGPPPGSPPASPPPGGSQQAPPSTPPVFGGSGGRAPDEEPEFFAPAPQTPEFVNPIVDVFSGGYGGFGDAYLDAEGGGFAAESRFDEGTFGAGWF